MRPASFYLQKNITTRISTSNDVSLFRFYFRLFPRYLTDRYIPLMLPLSHERVRALLIPYQAVHPPDQSC